MGKNVRKERKYSKKNARNSVSLDVLKDIVAQMRNPKSTCKRCEFTVCPSLNIFADMVENVYAAAEAERSRFYRALTPIIGINTEYIEKTGIDCTTLLRSVIQDAQRIFWGSDKKAKKNG